MSKKKKEEQSGCFPYLLWCNFLELVCVYGGTIGSPLPEGESSLAVSKGEHGGRIHVGRYKEIVGMCPFEVGVDEDRRLFLQQLLLQLVVRVLRVQHVLLGREESRAFQLLEARNLLGAVIRHELACDLEIGLSTPNVEESQVNQAMARIAKERILVADSSKFGKRSLSRIIPLADIDVIITDRNLPADMQSELRSRELKLMLV